MLKKNSKIRRSDPRQAKQRNLYYPDVQEEFSHLLTSIKLMIIAKGGKPHREHTNKQKG